MVQGICSNCNSGLSEADRNTGPDYPEVGWVYYVCPDCEYVQNADLCEEKAGVCTTHGFELMPTVFDTQLCPTCYGDELESQLTVGHREIDSYLLFANNSTINEIANQQDSSPEMVKAHIEETLNAISEAGLIPKTERITAHMTK